MTQTQGKPKTVTSCTPNHINTRTCPFCGQTPAAPRIVAECWTCAYVDLNLDGSRQRERKPADLYACRTWNEVDKHRAAGHDVREVSNG